MSVFIFLVFDCKPIVHQIMQETALKNYNKKNKMALNKCQFLAGILRLKYILHLLNRKDDCRIRAY